MEIECRYCRSKDIIKYGTKNNKVGKTQIFLCKACNKFFSDNTTFFRMKHKGEIITVVLDLYCKNVSLRRIVEHLKLVYGVKITHVTVLNWIRKYSEKFKKFTKNLKANNSNSIHVDEMMVNIDGKWYWWWEALDKENKMILSTHLSKTREISDAIKVFSEVKRKSTNKIDNIVTDGLHAYEKAYTKTFYTLKTPRTNHIKLIRFFDKVNNNVIERLHGSIRERTKVMRGFDKPYSARKILELWTTYYNFIRPHYSLGSTPAEISGINLPLNGGNRWLELIKLSTQTNGFSKVDEDE
jgi:transposase-like protein